jgi:hypothetical protein
MAGRISKRVLIGEPAFRADLTNALRAAGELCFVVLYAQGGGQKDWYVAQNQEELDTVFARIRPIGPWGYSDRIEVYATGEFPYRTRDDHAWLRTKARHLVETTGEVVLACRRDADPQLHDVENTDHVGVIDEWLSEPHEGEWLVGAHPFRHPDGMPGVVVAWNPNEDGAIRPGAY